MKKSLALLCLILMTMTLWSADRVKRNGLVYNLDHTTMTAEVTSKQKKHLYRGKNYKDATIVIPSTIKYKGRHYKVTSIGEEAFSYCYDLISVTIPNTITSIGKDAFYHCGKLNSVTIPHGVTSIESRTFALCHLTSVTIPKSVKSIGEGAFMCCDFTSVTIPNNVASIGDEAFWGCRKLTSITLPNGIKSIRKEMFAECEDLTSIMIPNGVTTIGEGAFKGCHDLASVTIPNSVKTIGKEAFRACFSLQSLKIPESVTSIEEEAFAFCDHLISISVAYGNKYYDSRNNCNALIETATNKLIAGCKNTVIPKGVTSIGADAFISCDGLKSIKIPNGVKSIGSYAFAFCDSLTSITLPKSVTSIETHAFWECKNLASVKLSKQTKLGDDVFKDCSKSLQLAYYAPSSNKQSSSNKQKQKSSTHSTTSTTKKATASTAKQSTKQTVPAGTSYRTDVPGGGYMEYTMMADGRILMKQVTPCVMCHGSHVCIACYGQGGRWGAAYGGMWYPCTMCGGTGQNHCMVCSGKGEIVTTSIIDGNGFTGFDSNGATYVGNSAGTVVTSPYGTSVYPNGGSSNGSGNSNKSTSTTSSDNDYIEKIVYAPDYTGDSPDVWCEKCQKWGPRHSHIRERVH